jgi:hypothetical protein
MYLRKPEVPNRECLRPNELLPRVSVRRILKA